MPRHRRIPTDAEVEFLKSYTNDRRIIQFRKDEGLEFLQNMYSLIGHDAIDLFSKVLDEAFHQSSSDLDMIL